jgi:hypothetical protein
MNVAPHGHRCAEMNDDEVIEAAEAEGFRVLLADRSAESSASGFVRGDDLRCPVLGEERLAFSDTADWLPRRARLR